MKARESVEVPELDMTDRRTSRRSSLSSDQFGMTDNEDVFDKESVQSSSETYSVSKSVELFTFGTKRTVFVRDNQGCELTTIPQGSVVRVSSVAASGEAYQIQTPVQGWIFQNDHYDGNVVVTDWDQIMVQIEDYQISVPWTDPSDTGKFSGNSSVEEYSDTHQNACSENEDVSDKESVQTSSETCSVISEPGLFRTKRQVFVRDNQGCELTIPRGSVVRVSSVAEDGEACQIETPVQGCIFQNDQGMMTLFDGTVVATKWDEIMVPEIEGHQIVVPSKKKKTKKKKTKKLTGKVTSWFADRGFGFIRPTGATLAIKDVFVHVSDVKNEKLSVGENVSFKLRRNDRTREWRAVKVVGVRMLPISDGSTCLAEFLSQKTTPCVVPLSLSGLQSRPTLKTQEAIPNKSQFERLDEDEYPKLC